MAQENPMLFSSPMPIKSPIKTIFYQWTKCHISLFQFL